MQIRWIEWNLYNKKREQKALFFYFVKDLSFLKYYESKIISPDFRRVVDFKTLAEFKLPLILN